MLLYASVPIAVMVICMDDSVRAANRRPRGVSELGLHKQVDILKNISHYIFHNYLKEIWERELNISR